jgi:hypothetical protein
MSLAFDNNSGYHLQVREQRSFHAHPNLTNYDFTPMQSTTAIIY